MPQGARAKWIAARKPGHCPGLGRVEGCLGLSVARGVLCGAACCRAEYHRLTGQERSPGLTVRRTVASMCPSEDNPRRTLVTLAECGHVLEMPRSYAVRRQGRRVCPTCTAANDEASA